MKKHAARHVRAALWTVLFVAVLAGWAQSYRGGWALAFLKNHQNWQISSYKGGLFWSWAHAPSPSPRRWKIRAWQPIDPPDSSGLGGYEWTPEDDLHGANYFLVSTDKWDTWGFFTRWTAHQWCGFLIARGDERVIDGEPPAWKELRLPYWFLTTVFTLLAATAIFRWWQKRHEVRRIREGLCLHCGYDLRGSMERCPECGNRIPAGPRPKSPTSPAQPEPAPLATRLRHLDLQLRKNAAWIVISAVLGLILLMETRPRAQDPRITASLVLPEISPLRAPEVNATGVSQLKLHDAMEMVVKHAGMPVDIDWHAFGDPPPPEGTVLNQQYHANNLPLTRYIELILEDVVWQNKLQGICFYVTGSPPRLLVTTKTVLLDRFAATASFRLPDLVEPKTGLSSDSLRHDRCDRLCRILQFELQNAADYSGAVETENHDTTLTIRTLPEYQKHMAALLDALRK